MSRDELTTAAPPTAGETDDERRGMEPASERRGDTWPNRS